MTWTSITSWPPIARLDANRMIRSDGCVIIPASICSLTGLSAGKATAKCSAFWRVTVSLWMMLPAKVNFIWWTTILVSSLQITRMILCTAKFTNSVAQISSYPVLMTMKNVALSLPSRLHMYGARKMCKPRVAKSLPHGSTFTIVLPKGCNLFNLETFWKKPESA